MLAPRLRSTLGPFSLLLLSTYGAAVAAGCAGTDEVGTGGSGAGGADGQGGSAADGGAGGSDCVPGTEICDGKDNDCDQQIDEVAGGCACQDGQTQDCYSGRPSSTAGIGECRGGTQTCEDGKWGACEGEVTPVPEVCNTLDDDCNGATDDMGQTSCGVGACSATVDLCVNGQPQVCVPGMPAPEVCDGVDNNCNQVTDESDPALGAACDSGLLGVCQAGTNACQNGSLVCVQNQMAGQESCDNLDNDCDGSPDDNIPGTGGACSTGQSGVCGPGTISCQNGVIDCFSNQPATPEVCDNLDNDCNGATDENNPGGGGACMTGQLGVCAQGTLNCQGGSLACTPNAQASAEQCDGADNNCNGQADEGNPGSGQPCTCGGSSACSGGQLLCQGCTREVVCNDGIDEENDGATDCADSQCALGCNANVGPCAPGEQLFVLSSSDVPKSIVDNSTVSSVMTFSEARTVTRVALQLNITHTYDADLDITLRSPDNTNVDVTSDNGSSGDNFTNTIFNSACATSVVSGSAPFAGCYAPEQSFSTFVGKQLQGTWTLLVADDAGADVGSLQSWTLAMCVTP